MNKKSIKAIVMLLTALQTVPAQAMWARLSRAALHSNASNNSRRLASIAENQPMSQSNINVSQPTLLARALAAQQSKSLSKRSERSQSENLSRLQRLRKVIFRKTISPCIPTALNRNTPRSTASLSSKFNGSHNEHQSWWQRWCKLLFGGSLSAGAATTLIYNASTDVESLSDENSIEQKPNSNNVAQLKYTINLMWINKNFQESMQYIYPSTCQEDFEQKFLNIIVTWAIVNPNAVLHIWYDSKFITSQALRNTQNRINALQTPAMAQIELKDVRAFSLVQNNPEIFSEKMPVYFRADLLRVIATIDTLSKCDDLSYFVYADLDIQPMSQAELFDKPTQENLEEFGFIMDQDDVSWFGFENGFQITSNKKPLLLKAMKRILIKLNIERAYNILQNDFEHVPMQNIKTPMKTLQQIVYESYLDMINYYYALIGHGQLRLCENNEKYDYHKHGLSAFGTKKRYGKLSFNCENEELIKKKSKHALTGFFIPTKKVTRPPANNKYE